MTGPTMAERYSEARSHGRPLVGGHRGNPAEEPENTLRSFESALTLGVDIVECDVHLSSDGQLVVIHDHSVDRTTGSPGMVNELSTQQLRALDAGSGERIPLLEEVVELVRGRAGLVIELKQAPLAYPGLEEKLVEKLRALEVVDQVSVISFRHASSKRVKELEPRIQVGILEVGIPVDPLVLLRQANADIYAPAVLAADPELVRLVQGAGAVVGMWVVDDDLSFAWAQLCRPDSIFTNRPREILQRLART